jgi:hypothetical protein
MKLVIKVLICSVAFVLLSSCKDDDSSGDDHILGATGAAGSCEVTGKTYLGADGQGGEVTEGCEGCGNDGLIEFESDRAMVLWPGSDIREECNYGSNGASVEINCSDAGVTYNLSFSNNCETLSGNDAIFNLKQD